MEQKQLNNSVFNVNRSKLSRYFFSTDTSVQIENNLKLLSFFHTFILSTIVLSFVVLLIYIGWSLDRGFDITDEAFYLTSAMYPDTIKASTTFHSWLISPIWFVTGTLASFRLFGVIMLLFSASVLALGVHYCCEKIGLNFTDKKAPILMVITSITASLLYGSFVYFSPSYNLLASTFTYLAIGFCLFATKRTVSWKLLSLHLLSGISISLIFLAKFSSAITVIVIVLIYMSLYSYSIKERLYSFVSLILGFVLTTTFFICYYSTFEQVRLIIELGVEQRGLGFIRPIGDLLVYYFTEYFSYISTVLSAFALPLFSLISYQITKQKFFAAFSFISLVIILVTKGYLLGGSTFDIYSSQMTGLIAILFMVGVSTFIMWTKNIKVFFLFFGLFLLPYCISVGTGNSLVWQVILSLSSWGVLISVFIFTGPIKSQANFLVLGLCSVFIVIITSQVVTAGLNSPYHLNKPLTQQNIPVKIGDIGTVLVDTETKAFIDGLSKAVKTCNILPGTPYIGLYNNIGIALAIKGKPFFTHWIDTPQQVQFSFEHTEAENVKNSVIGLRHWGNAQGQIVLPKALADFSNKYRLCGMVTYPFQNQPIGIYQPKQVGQ